MSDKELAERIKKGDMVAFDELVNLYAKKIINMSYSLLYDAEEAQDAAQEVFIKIYKNINSFRGESSVSTWIYRITRNVCCDILRKRKNTNVISLDFEDKEGHKNEPQDLSPTPSEVAEKNERDEFLRKSIASLDEVYKTVITLYDIEGLSYEEIAEVMKCPVGTVKSRIYRARDALRKLLEKNPELFE